jgi:phage terminase large subunit GpA-like protein
MTFFAERESCSSENFQFSLTESECLVFRAPEPISVSAWAARSVIIQDGPYRGGRMRLDVNPYLFPLMDMFGRRGLEQITICGSAQTGKTLLLYVCLGFAIERMPGTKMLAMPDDGVLARVEEEKLKPLLYNSPGLKKLMGRATSGHLRLMDGSSLFLSSASAKAQRASITVRVLGMDEVDLFPAPSLGQGHPVREFLERTRSYSFSRKIVQVSKPLGGEASSIWSALLASDLILAFSVRCPRCKTSQFMVPENLLALPLADESGQERPPAPLEISRHKLGRYQCSGCGLKWTDLQRDQAVAAGQWQPVRLKLAGQDLVIELGENIDNPRSVGAWLPACLSQAVSLSEIAAEAAAVRAADSPEDMQAYVNGQWALPYAAVALEPAENIILARVERSLPARVLPYDAVTLTMGIDTQKYGFYYLVLAWTPRMVKYVIDYGQIENFDTLTSLLLDVSYRQMDSQGGYKEDLHQVWRAAIDTGGTKGEEAEYSRTEEVYEYVRYMGSTGILNACKGASRELDKAVRWNVMDRMPGSGKPIPEGLRLYHLDTHKLKSSLFASLLDSTAKRPIWIYGQEDEGRPADHTELINHLCAEHQIVTPRGIKRWERVGRRPNHFLDCLVLALSCGDVSWTPSLHHYLMQSPDYTFSTQEDRNEKT